MKGPVIRKNESLGVNVGEEIKKKKMHAGDPGRCRDKWEVVGPNRSGLGGKRGGVPKSRKRGMVRALSEGKFQQNIKRLEVKQKRRTAGRQLLKKKKDMKESRTKPARKKKGKDQKQRADRFKAQIEVEKPNRNLR